VAHLGILRTITKTSEVKNGVHTCSRNPSLIYEILNLYVLSTR